MIAAQLFWHTERALDKSVFIRTSGAFAFKTSALAPDPHSGSSGHSARAVKRPRQHFGEGRYLNPGS